MANKEFNYEDLGKRIQEARKRNHLTQEEVATECGYSTKYISKIETGTSKPSLDLLTKLCAVLSVSLDDLVQDSKYVSKAVLNVRVTEIFNQLSDANQKIAIANLSSLLEIQENA